MQLQERREVWRGRAAPAGIELQPAHRHRGKIQEKRAFDSVERVIGWLSCTECPLRGGKKTSFTSDVVVVGVAQL